MVLFRMDIISMISAVAIPCDKGLEQMPNTSSFSEAAATFQHLPFTLLFVSLKYYDITIMEMFLYAIKYEPGVLGEVRVDIWV